MASVFPFAGAEEASLLVGDNGQYNAGSTKKLDHLESFLLREAYDPLGLFMLDYSASVLQSALWGRRSSC
jgi:hypothetical protein